MIINPILAEKERVQKERVQIELVEESGYDMKKYSELVHQLFLEVQEQYGLKFKYADRAGGLIRPPVPQDFSSPPTLVKA